MKQLQGILSRVMRPSAIQAELASLTAEPGRAPGPLRPPVGAGAADAARLRADLARRRHRRHGVHHRRERHRQGGRRADRARLEPQARQALPGCQLRRRIAQPHRERDLRPREGLLHRRRPPAPGLLRTRPRWHPVSRRNHRDAAGAAGAKLLRRARGPACSCAVGSTVAQETDVRAWPPPTAPPELAGGLRQAARGLAVPPERVPDRAVVLRDRSRTSRCWPSTSSPPSASSEGTIDQDLHA